MLCGDVARLHDRHQWRHDNHDCLPHRAHQHEHMCALSRSSWVSASSYIAHSPHGSSRESCVHLSSHPHALMMCAILLRFWSLLSLHFLLHAPLVALLLFLDPLEVRRQLAHSVQREYGLCWRDLLPHITRVANSSRGNGAGVVDARVSASMITNRTRCADWPAAQETRHAWVNRDIGEGRSRTLRQRRLPRQGADFEQVATTRQARTSAATDSIHLKRAITAEQRRTISGRRAVWGTCFPWLWRQPLRAWSWWRERESIARVLQRIDTMQSVGDVNSANISDMAALLDHVDRDGLLRALRRTYVFWRAGRDVCRVQLWNHCETASRRHPMAWVRLGATSFELDDSRCVYGTHRAVLTAEEESQRETASDTPWEGGVAVIFTVRRQVTHSEWEECWQKGFVDDAARGSRSEGKHRSEFDPGVFSNTVRNCFQSTTFSAEEHTQLQGRIARTIRKEQKNIT